MLPRSDEGGGRASAPGEGDGEDAFRFVLSRDEFVDLFLNDLELPNLAKRKLAEAESEGLRRAGYSTSGSPGNISVSRTVRLALARRVAVPSRRLEHLCRPGLGRRQFDFGRRRRRPAFDRNDPSGQSVLCLS
jgi:uncharacterized sporulation protein YeaH/YhbH (DUF444 family)